MLTTLFAPNPNLNDLAAKPYEQTKEAGSFVIDPAELGASVNLWTHRYSDAAGGAGLGRSYRSAAITVHKAAASGFGAVRVMGIGDSIMSGTLSSCASDPGGSRQFGDDVRYMRPERGAGGLDHHGPHPGPHWISDAGHQLR